MRISPGNAQDIGARKDQQDAFGFSDPGRSSFVSHGGVAAVVADGMGGLAHGAKASKTAVNAFLLAYEAKMPSESVQDALERSLVEANRAVCSLAAGADMKSGVGTTLSAAVIHDGHIHWISAGDSRVYLCHEGEAVRLTRDHVYGNDLDKSVARGRMNRADALQHPGRADLTSYLGVQEIAEIDRSTKPVPVGPNDTVFVCTDGLYRALSDGEIASSVRDDPHRSCEILLHRALAKRRAQQDNVTVIALRLTASAPAGSSKKVMAAVLCGLVVLAGAGGVWRSRRHTKQTSVVQTAKVANTVPAGNKKEAVAEPTPKKEPPHSTTKTKQAPGGSKSLIDEEGKQSPAIRDPVIANFSADRLAIGRAGDEVTLSWVVTGDVKSVTLNGGPVTAEAQNFKMHPEQATEYKLIATGTSGQTAVKTIVIGLEAAMQTPPAPARAASSPAPPQVPQLPQRKSAVISPPSILGFEAEPTEIAPGGTVHLSWEISGTVTAADIEGDRVEKVGTLDVRPAGSRSYRLFVNGPGGSKDAVVKVRVSKGPVKIVTFAAEPARIRNGQTATLRWKVEGAVDQVTIQGQPVQRAGEMSVHPTRATDYELVASGANAGKLTEHRKVTVDRARTAATIQKFRWAPEAVVSGHKVTLTWEVKGASRVVLNGVVQEASTCTDYPTVPTAYTLAAQGPEGTDPDILTVHVDVIPDPSPAQKRGVLNRLLSAQVSTCKQPIPQKR